MNNDFLLSAQTCKRLFVLSLGLTVLGHTGLVQAQSSLEIAPPASTTPNPVTQEDASPQSNPASQSQQSVTESVRLGDDRYAQADYQGAVEAYSQALQTFKLNAHALYNRANAYRQLEEYESAIADYTAALKIAPDNLFAFLYRGIALSEAEQPDAAIADFTKVIEQNPRHSLAFQHRGESHLAAGNPDSAAQDFQTAASLFESEGKHRKQSQALKLLKKAKSAQPKK